jgi:hypothetical protein
VDFYLGKEDKESKENLRITLSKHPRWNIIISLSKDL